MSVHKAIRRRAKRYLSKIREQAQIKGGTISFNPIGGIEIKNAYVKGAIKWPP